MNNEIPSDHQHTNTKGIWFENVVFIFFYYLCKVPSFILTWYNKRTRQSGGGLGLSLSLSWTVPLCCSTWSIFHDFLKRNFSIINSVCDVPGAASPVPWLGWWDTWGRSRWRSCSRPSTCSTLTGAATSAGGAQTKCPSRLLPVSQWVIWFLFLKVFLENLQQGTRIRHEKSWDESNWEGHSWHP